MGVWVGVGVIFQNQRDGWRTHAPRLAPCRSVDANPTPVARCPVRCVRTVHGAGSVLIEDGIYHHQITSLDDACPSLNEIAAGTPPSIDFGAGPSTASHHPSSMRPRDWAARACARAGGVGGQHAGRRTCIASPDEHATVGEGVRGALGVGRTGLVGHKGGQSIDSVDGMRQQNMLSGTHW